MNSFLNKLLKDSTTEELEEYREFLHDQYSAENLNFWVEVEQFKSLPNESEEDKQKIIKRAKEIYQKYFSTSSDYELNVPQALKMEMESKMSNPTIDIFNDIQNSVLILMAEGSYPSFLLSDRYKKMKEPGHNKARRQTPSKSMFESFLASREAKNGKGPIDSAFIDLQSSSSSISTDSENSQNISGDTDNSESKAQRKEAILKRRENRKSFLFPFTSKDSNGTSPQSPPNGDTVELTEEETKKAKKFMGSFLLMKRFTKSLKDTRAELAKNSSSDIGLPSLSPEVSKKSPSNSSSSSSSSSSSIPSVSVLPSATSVESVSESEIINSDRYNFLHPHSVTVTKERASSDINVVRNCYVNVRSPDGTILKTRLANGLITCEEFVFQQIRKLSCNVGAIYGLYCRETNEWLKMDCTVMSYIHLWGTEEGMLDIKEMPEDLLIGGKMYRSKSPSL